MALINRLTPLAPFNEFLEGTPVIPKLYWDVYSAEQRWKKICCWLEKLTEYSDNMNVNINLNREDIKKLNEEFEKFKESGFEDYYIEQITNWINQKTDVIEAEIINKFLIKNVYFGLTDEGHFCANIPEKWQDIIFDTGKDIENGTYGRLILRYNIDKSINTVDFANN